MAREIRSFDYVNHPYADVCAVLQADAGGVIHAATTVASSRADVIAAELRVEVAGLKVSAPIELETWSALEDMRGPGHARQLRIPINWKGADRPGLFPVMRGELRVYPLTGTETQLDFSGDYDPPMGAVGLAIDAAIGHRIAEACVHRFVTELAQHLRTRLSVPAATA